MSATTLDTAGTSRARLGLRAAMIAAVVILAAFPLLNMLPPLRTHVLAWIGKPVSTPVSAPVNAR